MKGVRSPRRSAEEGAAAVEAGVIMSVLLLLIVGSLELGRAFWTHSTMLLAIEEAGRYAMTYRHGSATTCGAQSQAANCPTLSNTPLANCSASRAQQVLSAYQVPNIGVSVSEDTTTVPGTILWFSTASSPAFRGPTDRSGLAIASWSL